MFADHESHVRRLIAQTRPESILAIGPRGHAVFGDYVEAHPHCRLHCLAGDDLSAQLAQCGRYGFTFVSDTLEHLPKGAAESLIARLRDVHAERLCVAVPIGARDAQQSAWEHLELIAFGFTLLRRYPALAGRAGALHLYGYDVASYKQTPDWLNPRYWAHPELWDKYRW